MIKKYKYFTKVRNIRLFPSRLLKFKKSKWVIIKRVLVKRIQRLKSSIAQSSNLGSKKYIHQHIFDKTKKIPAEKLEKKQFFLKRFRLGSSPSLISEISKIKFRKYFPERNPAMFSKFNLRDRFKSPAKLGRFNYMSRLSKDKTRLKIKLKKFLNQDTIPNKTKFSERDDFVKSVYSDNFQLKGVLSSYMFFTSNSQIKDSIRQGFISVNDQKLGKIEALKLGDVISVNSKIVPIKENLNKFISCFSCPSYLETDIYSQKIVLIKDQNLCTEEDFHLSASEYVNIRKL